MNIVACDHCGSIEVSIRFDGLAYTTFKCNECDKHFTLRNN